MSTALYSLPPLHITRAEATALPAWSPGQPDALTTVHFRPNRSHDGMPDYRLTSACIDFLKRSYRADVITAGFLIGNAENGVITVHTAVPAPGLRYGR